MPIPSVRDATISAENWKADHEECLRTGENYARHSHLHSIIELLRHGDTAESEYAGRLLDWCNDGFVGPMPEYTGK